LDIANLIIVIILVRIVKCFDMNATHFRVSILPITVMMYTMLAHLQV